MKKSEKIAKVDELCVYFRSNLLKSVVQNREVIFPLIMKSRGCGIIGFGQNDKCCRGLALWQTLILQGVASHYMESDCKFAKRLFRTKT